MAEKRILLTGGSGQVGQSLLNLQWADGIILDAPSSKELNLADEGSIRAYLDAGSYEAIINCGAYTAVDKAEEEIEIAMAINGHAPAILAEYAASSHIPILHISTDYVFNGQKDGPYLESDTPDPISIYGQSKLAGEQAIIESGANAVIMRTAWVLSPYGHNFVKTMLRLGAERDNLSVVDDQYGNPTSAHDIASAIQTILKYQLNSKPMAPEIFHFVNAQKASWFDLAIHIFKQQETAGHKIPSVKPISTAEYPTHAKRPANSQLDTQKIQEKFGISPRNWPIAINDILKEIRKDVS